MEEELLHEEWKIAAQFFQLKFQNILVTLVVCDMLLKNFLSEEYQH